jgi:hypothetical protein
MDEFRIPKLVFVDPERPGSTQGHVGEEAMVDHVHRMQRQVGDKEEPPSELTQKEFHDLVRRSYDLMVGNRGAIGTADQLHEMLERGYPTGLRNGMSVEIPPIKVTPRDTRPSTFIYKPEIYSPNMFRGFRDVHQVVPARTQNKPSLSNVLEEFEKRQNVERQRAARRADAIEEARQRGRQILGGYTPSIPDLREEEF